MGRHADHATVYVFELIDGNVLTVVSCAFIALMFAVGWRHLRKERNHLAALNSYILLKYRLGHRIALESVARDVVEDITRVEEADEPARRQTHMEALWKRAVRLEGSVDFWGDLLQKLGLLGTVVGLGLALLQKQTSANDLLAPLSLAVWTTVIGLLGSIAISWKFGRDIDVEVDTHEEHLKEWQNALAARDPDGLAGRPALGAERGAGVAS
jgi:MotA/TolQ/ExbB proton channel family